MIGAILPAAVVAATARTDVATVVLSPAEEAAVANAVERRRREFATVRALAREAYAQLGVPAVPVVPGPHGEPTWAAGVVGSITHCDGYRACALAPAAEVLTVGIDAEPDAPLSEGVLGAVTRPEERAALAELTASRPDVSWDRLLFSAKEAAYKAWFPLLRRRLGFGDAVVTFDGRVATPDGGAFEVRLLTPAPAADGRSPVRLAGRWLARDGLVATAIAVAVDA